MTSRVSVNRILFDSATQAIPKLFAAVMFAAGTMLLVSVFTPIDPQVMPYVMTWLPLGLVEFSHAIGTIIAVVMLFIARGLWERIEAAWYMAIFLFCLGAVVSLTRELALINAILLIVCAMLLIPCKSAFNRRSNMLALSIHPGWAICTLATLGFIVWFGFYAYKACSLRP